MVASAEEEVQVVLRAQDGRRMEKKHMPAMRKNFSELSSRKQKEFRTDEK